MTGIDRRRSILLSAEMAEMKGRLFWNPEAMVRLAGDPFTLFLVNRGVFSTTSGVTNTVSRAGTEGSPNVSTGVGSRW